MKRYKGSEKTAAGVYLNTGTGEFVRIDEATRSLPGDNQTSYIKVPSALAVVSSPLAGLVFIMFLPFVGIVGFIGFLGYKLWRGMLRLVQNTLQLGSLSYQPGKAYFNRRPAGKKSAPKEEKELDAMADEVAERRKRGEQ